MEGFLFHTRTGHNLSATRGALQLSVRRAGITDLHFHDLRRTFATRVRQWTDAFTAKELMGHAQLSMTDSCITPPLEDMRAAVERLGQQPTRILQFGQKTG